jgi:hypothetical protein
MDSSAGGFGPVYPNSLYYRREGRTQKRRIALFICDYLLEHGEGYAQEIWRELKKTRERQHVCSYDSFKRNYVYVLKKLGLIEESRR